MKIVGVGCGPGLLTEQAIEVIRHAKSIYGSDRAIALAQPFIMEGCTTRTIDDFKSLPHLPSDTVILSTGDPMLAGLGYLPGEVIPGISSLQVAAARLRIPVARVSIVVAHGKGHEQGMTETVDEVRRGKIVFLLADPKFDVPGLFRRLEEAGITTPIRIAICENLGYSDERIAVKDLSNPPLPETDLYSLFVGNF